LSASALPDCKQVDIAAHDVQDEIDVIDRHWSMALERHRGGRRACPPVRGFGGRRLVGAVHPLDTSWTYSPPSATSSLCVPRRTTRPLLMTRISSQSRIVLSRCATMMQVHPPRRRLSSIAFST